MKSEQKLEDMVDIMDHMQQYVPTISSTEQVSVPESDIPVSVTMAITHSLHGKFILSILPNTRRKKIIITG